MLKVVFAIYGYALAIPCFLAVMFHPFYNNYVSNYNLKIKEKELR